MSATQPQHTEATLPLEDVPLYEQSIARAASIIGLGLSAASATGCLISMFKNGLTPLSYWAMFLTLYGLCIWYANHRDVPKS